MRSIGRLALAVVMLVPATACVGERGASPAPPAVVEQDTDCSNEITAIAAGTGETLEGDVTGDGGADRVSLVVDHDGERGCQIFVVVEGQERHVLAVGGDQTLEISADSVSQPRLQDLVDVDGRDGLEIAVVLLTGASTELVALFSMGGGDLARLEIEGGETLGNLLPLGGSVAHNNNVVCDERGRLVLVTATEQEGAYRVARTPFLAEEDSLLADLSETKSRTVPSEDLAEVKGLGAPAFDGCPR
jgi:hypothetical protein